MGEAPDALRPAVDFHVAQVSPVGLCLLARWSFESPHGDRPSFGALRLQPVFEDGVAASVAVLLELAQQHARVPHSRLQALGQVGLELVQFAGRL